MPEYNSIKIITDNDYCISCGACTHICPHDTIRMQYDSFRGKWDAIVQDTGKCVSCNGFKNCLAVCPSYNVDYMRLASSHENQLLGKIKSIYNGYSADMSTRLNASSGGFIRELSRTLLEKQTITGIITITHDGGMEYTPKILTDITEMPNSIYHNINFESAIDLLRNNEGKYLLIGLPCQITSILQLVQKKKFSFLKERLEATIALICGYTFDRTNMEAFAFFHERQLDQISYRENGRYRKTRLGTGDSSILFDTKRPQTLNEDIINRLTFDRLLVQENCLYCVDHIGYCADLVVGDAWLKRYSDDVSGTNLVIVRTDQGQDLIDRMNNFTFEQASINDIVESQHNEYAYGSIAETMKTMEFRHKTFIPSHVRTETQTDIKKYSFSLVERIKIRYLKQIMRNRLFILAKSIYIILNLNKITKLALKKRLGLFP